MQNLGNCGIKTHEQGREINSIRGPNIALVFEKCLEGRGHFFFMKNILYFECLNLTYVYECFAHMCVVPEEARKGH